MSTTTETTKAGTTPGTSNAVSLVGSGKDPETPNQRESAPAEPNGHQSIDTCTVSESDTSPSARGPVTSTSTSGSTSNSSSASSSSEVTIHDLSIVTSGPSETLSNMSHSNTIDKLKPVPMGSATPVGLNKSLGYCQTQAGGGPTCTESVTGIESESSLSESDGLTLSGLVLSESDSSNTLSVSGSQPIVVLGQGRDFTGSADSCLTQSQCSQKLNFNDNLSSESCHINNEVLDHQVQDLFAALQQLKTNLGSQQEPQPISVTESDIEEVSKMTIDDESDHSLHNNDNFDPGLGAGSEATLANEILAALQVLKKCKPEADDDINKGPKTNNDTVTDESAPNSNSNPSSSGFSDRWRKSFHYSSDSSCLVNGLDGGIGNNFGQLNLLVPRPQLQVQKQLVNLKQSDSDSQDNRVRQAPQVSMVEKPQDIIQVPSDFANLPKLSPDALDYNSKEFESNTNTGVNQNQIPTYDIVNVHYNDNYLRIPNHLPNKHGDLVQSGRSDSTSKRFRTDCTYSSHKQSITDMKFCLSSEVWGEMRFETVTLGNFGGNLGENLGENHNLGDYHYEFLHVGNSILFPLRKITQGGFGRIYDVMWKNCLESESESDSLSEVTVHTETESDCDVTDHTKFNSINCLTFFDKLRQSQDSNSNSESSNFIDSKILTDYGFTRGALKLIPFGSKSEEKMCCREIAILKSFKGDSRSNVLQIWDSEVVRGTGTKFNFTNNSKATKGVGLLLLERADYSLKDYIDMMWRNNRDDSYRYDVQSRNLDQRHSIDLVEDLMVQMSIAVDSLHKRGIVHADLKTENFLVFFNNDSHNMDVNDSDSESTATKPNIKFNKEFCTNVTVKVADFGISQCLPGYGWFDGENQNGNQNSCENSINPETNESDFEKVLKEPCQAAAQKVQIQRRIGTVCYMAPEIVCPQLAYNSPNLVGRGIDIWSLGICFYVLLYNKFPEKHDGETITEVLFAIRDQSRGIRFEKEWERVWTSTEVKLTTTDSDSGDHARYLNLLNVLRGCLDYYADGRRWTSTEVKNALKSKDAKSSRVLLAEKHREFQWSGLAVREQCQAGSNAPDVDNTTYQLDRIQVELVREKEMEWNLRNQGKESESSDHVKCSSSGSDDLETGKTEVQEPYPKSDSEHIKDTKAHSQPETVTRKDETSIIDLESEKTTSPVTKQAFSPCAIASIVVGGVAGFGLLIFIAILISGGFAVGGLGICCGASTLCDAKEEESGDKNSDTDDSSNEDSGRTRNDAHSSSSPTDTSDPDSFMSKLPGPERVGNGLIEPDTAQIHKSKSFLDSDTLHKSESENLALPVPIYIEDDGKDGYTYRILDTFFAVVSEEETVPALDHDSKGTRPSRSVYIFRWNDELQRNVFKEFDFAKSQFVSKDDVKSNGLPTSKGSNFALDDFACDCAREVIEYVRAGLTLGNADGYGEPCWLNSKVETDSDESDIDTDGTLSELENLITAFKRTVMLDRFKRNLEMQNSLEDSQPKNDLFHIGADGELPSEKEKAPFYCFESSIDSEDLDSEFRSEFRTLIDEDDGEKFFRKSGGQLIPKIGLNFMPILTPTCLPLSPNSPNQTLSPVKQAIAQITEFPYDLRSTMSNFNKFCGETLSQKLHSTQPQCQTLIEAEQESTEKTKSNLPSAFRKATEAEVARIPTAFLRVVSTELTLAKRACLTWMRWRMDQAQRLKDVEPDDPNLFDTADNKDGPTDTSQNQQRLKDHHLEDIDMFVCTYLSDYFKQGALLLKKSSHSTAAEKFKTVTVTEAAKDHDALRLPEEQSESRDKGPDQSKNHDDDPKYESIFLHLIGLESIYQLEDAAEDCNLSKFIPADQQFTFYPFALCGPGSNVVGRESYEALASSDASHSPTELDRLKGNIDSNPDSDDSDVEFETQSSFTGSDLTELLHRADEERSRRGTPLVQRYIVDRFNADRIWARKFSARGIQEKVRKKLRNFLKVRANTGDHDDADVDNVTVKQILDSLQFRYWRTAHFYIDAQDQVEGEGGEDESKCTRKPQLREILHALSEYDGPGNGNHASSTESDSVRLISPKSIRDIRDKSSLSNWRFFRDLGLVKIEVAPRRMKRGDLEIICGNHVKQGISDSQLEYRFNGSFESHCDCQENPDDANDDVTDVIVLKIAIPLSRRECEKRGLVI